MTSIVNRVRPVAHAAGRVALAVARALLWVTAWRVIRHFPCGVGRALKGIGDWLTVSPRTFLPRLGCIGVAAAAFLVVSLVGTGLAIGVGAAFFDALSTTVLVFWLPFWAWAWLVGLGLLGRSGQGTQAEKKNELTKQQTRIVDALRATVPAIRAAWNAHQPGDPPALTIGPITLDPATGAREVTLTLPYGASPADVGKNRAALAKAFRVARVDQVTVTAGDRVDQAVIHIAAVSPSERVPSWELEHADRADLTTPLAIGVDMQGRPVALRLFGADERGRLTGGSMVIGGSTDSGKTSFMRLLVAAAALDPRAVIAVADLKGDNDFATLAPALDWHRVEDTPEHLADLKTMIGQALDHMRAVQNGTADRRPVLIIIDECQEVFGRGKDKELAGMVEQLVRRGRSAGIYVIVATQRPTSDSIPTSLRDNCRDKVCLRVGDQTTGAVVLDQLAYAPDTDPTSFGAGAQGMAVTDAPGHRGKVKLAHVTSKLAGRAARVHPRTPGALFGVQQEQAQAPAGDPFPTYGDRPQGDTPQDPDEAPEPFVRPVPAAPASIVDHLDMVWPDSQDRASTAAMLMMLLSIDSTRYAGWELDDVTRELKAAGWTGKPSIWLDGKSQRGAYRADVMAAKGGCDVRA